MKDVFLVYDRCCFYEIVILSYFLNYSPCDLVFCSPCFTTRPHRSAHLYI